MLLRSKIRSASSTSPPENAKPPDLRKEYGAPFTIISRNEGSRYTSLTNRDFNLPIFLDFQHVARLGWTNPIAAYCRALSLKKFVKMRHDGYRQLMLEFYTTLSFTDDGFQCRLMGKSVTVTLKTLCDIFGFSEEGHTTVPEDFDPTEFWREIAGDGDFKNGKMFANHIKDPCLRLMYQYISQGVFGKARSTLVVLKELFCLWCAYTNVPVCTPSFVMDSLKSVITNKRTNMCLGNFITAIALHFGAFNPLDTDMLVFPARAFMVRKCLKGYKCDKSATEDASSSDGDDDDGEDGNPVTDDDQPAVNNWMLISHKLEQMHTQMKDAMETRFDGLEKEVNAMRESFKSFEREMKDLGNVELNSAKTVEEMKLEIVEANKSIEKLKLEKLKSDEAAEMYKARLEIVFPRLKKIHEGLTLPMISGMKVVDLANLENDSPKNMIMPDVNAQEAPVLLPGVCVTSTASGNTNKGLPNNCSDGNSTQPRTSEDDISRPVKKSLGSGSGHNPPRQGSNECIEPPPGSVAHASDTHIISGKERFCKTTLPPLAAAGDAIIETNDSDNEAEPDRAVKTSKRAMSSDVGENEMNFVQLSKRSRTERMEKLSPFSNSERKKDVLTHGKEKDDSSGDSEDESLSDSRMEDLIASLRGEKCVRKFMYEADMLSALRQDEELCLNSVCALYRQTLSSRKPNGSLTWSKKGGFSSIDSMSGCSLAEYLIDEDKELRLTKSVSQVKRQRPDVITQCRRLATGYVGRLFEIYCTGDDPLFCQL